MPPPSHGTLLALAVDVARAAGDLVHAGRPHDLRASGTKSSPTDVVTEMDTAAEALIASRLRAARPDDAVLGEEGGSSGGTSGVRWVVDPIDGTVNYLYGLPHWAVSIAAEVDGTVVAGVVHAPALGRTWTAVLGGGAFRDGTRVHCSPVTALAQTLVATGFGYEAARRAQQARVLRSVLPAVRDIRRLGASSLDLCAVADGTVDAYYERGLQPWDWAAGGLVAVEAGASLDGLPGRPPSGDLVVAAPPGVRDALGALLAPLGADHD